LISVMIGIDTFP